METKWWSEYKVEIDTDGEGSWEAIQPIEIVWGHSSAFLDRAVCDVIDSVKIVFIHDQQLSVFYGQGICVRFTKPKEELRDTEAGRFSRYPEVNKSCGSCKYWHVTSEVRYSGPCISCVEHCNWIPRED